MRAAAIAFFEPQGIVSYRVDAALRSDGAGFVSRERGAAFAPPAEGGVGRTTRRSRSSRLCCSTNLTAKPSGKSLTTRPTQAPTASGIPTCGGTSDETETPEPDMSITKQLRVLPSAKVRVE